MDEERPPRALGSNNPFAHPRESIPPMDINTDPRPSTTLSRNQNAIAGPSSSPQMFSEASQLSFQGSTSFTNVGGGIYNVNPNISLFLPHETTPAHQGSNVTTDSQGGSLSLCSSEHDSEVYARLLLPKKHGYPLWYPEPPQFEDQDDGLRIGDVGLVTIDGDFDFLFNICLAADHPINGDCVPENFRPIVPAPQDRDIKTISIAWKAGSHVSNGSVRTLQPRSLSDYEGKYCFEGFASEGALLTLPEGAKRVNLRSLASFYKYAGENAQYWYKFANGPRGRMAPNGSLYLVTGFDKASSWGTASFSRAIGDGAFEMSFVDCRAMLSDNNRPLPTAGYPFTHMWNQSGHAATKEGPCIQNRDLQINRPQNQTVFLRGFAVALPEGIWASMMGKVNIVPIMDVEPPSQSQRSGVIPFLGGSTTNWFGFGSGTRTEEGRRHADGSLSGESSDAVVLSGVPTLRVFPDAQVAVTHDDIWCSVLDEGSTVLPQASELLKAIEEKYMPVCVEGVATFISRETGYLKQERSPIEQTAHFSLQADEPMSTADETPERDPDIVMKDPEFSPPLESKPLPAFAQRRTSSTISLARDLPEEHMKGHGTEKENRSLSIEKMDAELLSRLQRPSPSPGSLAPSLRARKSPSGGQIKLAVRGQVTHSVFYRACTTCIGRKVKCDGKKPSCGNCLRRGQLQCSYLKDNRRQPRTEAHFEAMKKRNEALEEYVASLETELGKYRGDRAHNVGGSVHFKPQNSNGLGPTDLETTEIQSVFSDTDRTPIATERTAAAERQYDNEQTLELALPFPYGISRLAEDSDSLLHFGFTPPFRFKQDTPMMLPFPFPEAMTSPKHKLLIDQAETGDDPCSNWAAFLPPNVPLGRKEHDKLLETCFKFSTAWCLQIIPDLFLRDMHRVLASLSPPTEQHSESSLASARTSHYSPMLHNALLAVATAFSDDPKVKDIGTRHAFASQAKSYIEAECQQPELSVVHALSFLGNFHFGLGEQTLGYMYFGMSVRISQALGLGIDHFVTVRQGLISEIELWNRSWTYWTILAQDIAWSLYVGRGATVSASECAEQVPMPHTDPQLGLILPQDPQSSVQLQANHLSATFKANCGLSLIARRILETVNGLDKASLSKANTIYAINILDLELEAWMSNLPNELKITQKSHSTCAPHLLTMHCVYWWLVMILHRPFFRQKMHYGSDLDPDHVKVCRRAVEHVASLTATWRSLYGLRNAPFVVAQTLFSAGTIHLLIALEAHAGGLSHEALPHAVRKAGVCVQHLREVGETWEGATNVAEILKELFEKRVKPVLNRPSAADFLDMSGTRSIPSHGIELPPYDWLGENFQA